MARRYQKYIFLVLVALLILGIFKFGSLNKQTEQDFKSPPGEPKFFQDQGVPSTLSTETLLDRDSSLRLSEDSTQEAQSDQSDMETTDSDEPVQQCWERLDNQLGNDSLLVRKKDEIESKIEPWIFNKDAVLVDLSAHAENKVTFYKALALGGFLMGRERPLNEAKAIELLNSLIQKDPVNSAPQLYLAVIYQRQGQQNKVTALEKSLQQTQFFNSYVIQFTQEFFDRIETSSDYIEAVGITSALPIPDYKEIINFIVARKFDFIAFQMMKKNFSKKPKIEMLEWVAIEYASGYSALRRLGVQHSYPNFKDFHNFNLNLHPLYIDKPFEELEKNCDLRTLDPVVEKLKKYVKEL